jgi:hypothetical protein
MVSDKAEMGGIENILVCGCWQQGEKTTSQAFRVIQNK